LLAASYPLVPKSALRRRYCCCQETQPLARPPVVSLSGAAARFAWPDDGLAKILSLPAAAAAAAAAAAELTVKQTAKS
jgi:hypothetical protein